MVSIQHAMQIVKDDLADLLQPQFIYSICRSLGHNWRRRILDPPAIIHLFILQILNNNIAIAGLRHLSPINFTASAYCQARKNLPLKIIEQLAKRVAGYLDNSCNDQDRWLGHRLWWIDGSSASMPDTPELQKYFGQAGGQKPGCGFPVASVLVRIHAKTGLLMDQIVRPLRTHEMSSIVQLHKHLQCNDVIVADRGFCSYAHLSLLLQSNMHVLFRLHQRVVVSFKANRPMARQLPKAKRKGKPSSQWVRRLGHDDQIVQYFKLKVKPVWMSEQQFESLPESIEVRELRYRIGCKGYRTRVVTLVTTLRDSEKYSKRELARQYLGRWQIEVDLRDLKITLGMDVLHCKTLDGVIKELWMFMLVYNLVRRVMLEAARRRGVEAHRISFIDTLRWLLSDKPGKDLAGLIVNPSRTGRVELRVAKCRDKEHKLMNKPRDELRKALEISRLIS